MNILFIAVDTLRADHLGCYGYTRNTSPYIDAFAAESVLFEAAVAPAIPTQPAFVTLNTGQYPITHGVVAHGGAVVPHAAPWLPKQLQQAGYTTCAIDNLAEWGRGFRRGYEFYIDPSQQFALPINCDNRTINRRAIPWLQQHGHEPFFLFVHYWDPHTPYLPPRAYRTLFYEGDPSDPNNRSLDGLARHPLGQTWRETWFSKLGKNITDANYIEALYDGEIRYCDEGVGQLLDALEERGLAGNTLVVLTSDHGELMYRHGIFFDHHGLYDGNIRVPLIVRLPRGTQASRRPSFDAPESTGPLPRRIPLLVTHADLAPTILELAGVPVPETMEGTSLAPLLQDQSDTPLHEFVVSLECTWQMKWCIRTFQHKFILARAEDFYGSPPRELYDLQRDPNEFHNIVEKQPDIARHLEERLESWIAQKMGQNGLTEDPLIAHGLTLGRAWQQNPQ
ncbi:MAG TPA: sulfatase [Candidatus Hydrogenedentes bacterium]|nr:sulfatase [Candidatus Hydrogenedentota bacterium]HIJ72988.1 sulfatase [Candidatus Hydrogenedentota bacterium]